MAMTLDELVTQLKSAYGDTLRSVVLYGSAVAGEHIEKKSDYNTLVILDSVPLDRLAAVGAVFPRRGATAAIPPPMMFTEAEWKGPADVFSDGIRRHSRAAQSSLRIRSVGGITVARSDLRLEVEQQALGKLCHPGGGAMAAGVDEKAQLALSRGA